MTAHKSIVMEVIIDLFYYGEVKVLSSIKSEVIKALDLLEVNYEIPTKRPTVMMPAGQPAKPPLPLPLPPPSRTPIDGQKVAGPKTIGKIITELIGSIVISSV